MRKEKLLMREMTKREYIEIQFIKGALSASFPEFKSAITVGIRAADKYFEEKGIGEEYNCGRTKPEENKMDLDL
jgi:hypothetical protein